MEYLIIIVLMVVLFKIFYKRIFIQDESESHNKKFSNSSKITPGNFRLRPSLLNSNERVFFEQLKLAVGNQYDIYPQTSLSAIFEPIEHWNNWGDLSRLNKRIDFVLFDKNTQTPKIAIELDGDSHSKFKSIKRDEFVGDLFEKFNIPLVRFNNGNYSAEEIKNKLSIFQLLSF